MAYLQAVTDTYLHNHFSVECIVCQLPHMLLLSQPREATLENHSDLTETKTTATVICTEVLATLIGIKKQCK